MNTSPLITVGEPLTLEHVYLVGHRAARAELAPSARARLATTRRSLEAALASGATIYGANTGFGALSETKINATSLDQLQKNLLRSHAVGVGPLLSAEQVRVLLALRAHTLSLGASGATPALPEALLQLLNLGIVPVVPSQGSVGASGDLAPLAHLALPLIGEGEAFFRGERMTGAMALAAAGLSPVQLGAKEGLSLINGTQVTSAIAALAAWEAAELLCAADIFGALTLDASLGTARICDPRIHALKPHAGQRKSAEQIAALIEGSQLAASHRDCGRVQDAYSLRCMPQVHGSVREALRYVAGAITTEINSATDNPLVLDREDGGFDVLSGGNFHAATVALPADHATAACTALATISERRLDRLMNAASSRGLPPFLANDPGLESGFMMVQVTASALASECKALSFPANVDTIPTSAGQEDHVSMGPIAARKFQSVVKNTALVLAIEGAIAARAIDLREHRSSDRLMRVHETVRKYVGPFEGDRSMTAELEALAHAILSGEIREAAGIKPEL